MMRHYMAALVALLFLSGPAHAQFVCSQGTTCVPLVDNLQHVAGLGLAPTIAAGTGAGSGPTVSVVGSDRFGQISILTGTTPTASGIVATITFASAWPNAGPYCLISPANGTVDALNTAALFVTPSTTATTFVMTAGTTALTAATTYLWNYSCGK